MEGQRYIIDRVGEETDLANCSVCHAISCFSCVQDHCTALEKAADGGCVFYKDAEDNRREIRRCFYRLIRHERFDLLEKYADTLEALGFMDEEMADAARQHDDLEKYRTTHYHLLLSSGWKETLTVVRPMETEEAQTEVFRLRPLYLMMDLLGHGIFIIFRKEVLDLKFMKRIMKKPDILCQCI